MLNIEAEGKVGTFYFRKGELIFANMNPEEEKKKVGQFLIEKGQLTEDQLNDALASFHLKGRTRRLGQILIKKGYITRTELISAIKDQMEEVVLEALSWKEGHFLFMGNDKPENEDILLDIKVDYLILKGLQRLQAENEEREKQPAP
jgi:hypothetical protein